MDTDALIGFDISFYPVIQDSRHQTSPVTFNHRRSNRVSKYLLSINLRSNRKIHGHCLQISFLYGTSYKTSKITNHKKTKLPEKKRKKKCNNSNKCNNVVNTLDTYYFKFKQLKHKFYFSSSYVLGQTNTTKTMQEIGI